MACGVCACPGFPNLRLTQVQEQGVREIASWLGGFSRATTFVGSGAWAYRQRIREILGGMASFPPDELLHPRASVIARLGMERLSSGSVDDLDSLEPLYLRSSQPGGV